MLVGDPRDLAHVILRQDRAGRVVRRVEDDHPGAIGHQGGHLGDVHPEVVGLAQGGGHRHPAHVSGHALVDREAGVGVDDLVALVDEGEHGVEHDRLGAGRDDHLLRGGLDPLPAHDVGGDGGSERSDASCRRVVRHLLVEQGVARGLADVARGVEVGLTDLQVDHVTAGRLQRPGARGGLEGGLGADPLHAAGKLHLFRCLVCGRSG